MGWFLNLFKKKNGARSSESSDPKPVPVDLPVGAPSSYIKTFPDVSHFEKCDFSKFDCDILLTKATDGLHFVDETLKVNIDECKKRNIKFGAYHFYRTATDPIDQAKHYIETVGLENLKSFYIEPIIDYETVDKVQSESDLKDNIPNMKKFMDYVFQQTGRLPMFYSYESLIQFLELDESMAKYRLWIARYGKEPTSYRPWKEYWAWQFSDGNITNPKYKDSFNGIGRCDSNVFFIKK